MCIDKHTVYFCFLKDDHMTVSAIDSNFFDWFCVTKVAVTYWLCRIRSL
jgi:hypothetical protein